MSGAIDGLGAISGPVCAPCPTFVHLAERHSTPLAAERASCASLRLQQVHIERHGRSSACRDPRVRLVAQNRRTPVAEGLACRSTRPSRVCPTMRPFHPASLGRHPASAPPCPIIVPVRCEPVLVYPRTIPLSSGFRRVPSRIAKPSASVRPCLIAAHSGALRLMPSCEVSPDPTCRVRSCKVRGSRCCCGPGVHGVADSNDPRRPGIMGRCQFPGGSLLFAAGFPASGFEFPAGCFLHPVPGFEFLVIGHRKFGRKETEIHGVTVTGSAILYSKIPKIPCSFL